MDCAALLQHLKVVQQTRELVGALSAFINTENESKAVEELVSMSQGQSYYVLPCLFGTTKPFEQDLGLTTIGCSGFCCSKPAFLLKSYVM